MALYAFSAEIAHVQEGVREPLTGEIRLQWWRDALNSAQAGIPEEGNSHPVAAALNKTIKTFDLPRQAFVNLIDARIFDLYQEPMPTLNELEGYCGETCSVLFQLAALILAGRQVDDVSEPAGYGGVAYAMTGLIRAFPWHVRSGKVFMPLELLERHHADAEKVIEGGDVEAVRQALLELRAIASGHLDRAEVALAEVPSGVRTAFLPLVFIRPYLKLMDRKDYNPFDSILDLPQWRKQWTLWRAARKIT